MSAFSCFYLLGRDEEGINYWLEEPSWDCGWYWGFGYVETYTTNEVKADKIADRIEKNLLDKGIRTNHYLKQFYEISEDSYEDLDKSLQ